MSPDDFLVVFAKAKQRGWTRQDIAAATGCSPHLQVQVSKGEEIPTHQRVSLERWILEGQHLDAPPQSVLDMRPAAAAEAK